MNKKSNINLTPLITIAGVLILAPIVIKMFLSGSKGDVSLKSYENNAKKRGGTDTEVRDWSSYARAIDKALNAAWYEDETLVYEIFMKFRNNEDAAETSAAYAHITGKDMLSDIQRLFSNAERNNLRKILDNKGITVFRV